MADRQTTDDRPGPGWDNICYRCLGSLIEWPHMGRCACKEPKRRICVTEKSDA